MMAQLSETFRDASEDFARKTFLTMANTLTEMPQPHTRPGKYDPPPPPPHAKAGFVTQPGCV